MANSIPTHENLSKLLNTSPQNGSGLKELMKAKQDSEMNPATVAPKPAATDAFSPSAKGIQAAAAMASYQAAYQYSETMSLSLQTKEGDRVTVDFRQLYAQYQAYEAKQAKEEGPNGVRQFESRSAMEATAFEEKFGFSIEGDLNEAETKAIFDVFQQVDELATQFFSGDIEQAFQKAVDMKVDFGQLQSVDINLQQTQTFAARSQQAAAYQGVQQSNHGGNATEGQGRDATVADLPPYLQRIQQVVEKMDAFFEDARSAMEEFMADIQAQRNPENGSPKSWLDRLRSFHEELINQADLDSVTLKPSGVVIDPNWHGRVPPLDAEQQANNAVEEPNNQDGTANEEPATQSVNSSADMTAETNSETEPAQPSNEDETLTRT